MTTEDRIAQLEDQLHQLQGQQADLRKQLAKAQLDQWQGRIEDLEVQMHLGAVEAHRVRASITELIAVRGAGSGTAPGAGRLSRLRHDVMARKYSHRRQAATARRLPLPAPLRSHQ